MYLANPKKDQDKITDHKTTTELIGIVPLAV